MTKEEEEGIVLDSFKSSGEGTNIIKVEEEKKQSKTILILVHFSLVLIHVLWGIIPVATKWVFDNEYFDPFVFNALRFIVSSISMLIFIVIQNRSFSNILPKKRIHLLYYIILGALFTAQQEFFMTGVDNTTASNSSVLYCLSPAWTMVMSILLRREKFMWLKLFGTILLITGAMVIVNIFSFSLTEGALGDILVIISTVAYAAYVVGQEVSTKATQDASQVLLWAMFITAIMLTSISLIFEPEEWSTVLYQPWGAYATVFYSAVVTTCICYGLIGWCLKHTTPIVAMSYLPVEPIAASIFALFLTGEELTLYFFVGFVIILGGLLFVILGRYREIQLEKKANDLLVG